MSSMQMYSEQLDPYGEKYTIDSGSIYYIQVPRNVAQLIFDDDNDLVDMNVSQQSIASQFSEEPLNLDGFEVHEAPPRKKTIDYDE